MKKFLLIVLPLAISSALAWYFYRQSFNEPLPAGLSPDPVRETAQSPLEDEFNEDTEDLGMDSELSREWRSGPAARRIVEVPPNEHFGQDAHRFEDIRNIEDDELGAFTDYNLEKALEGDLNAANRVVHAHRRCANAPVTAGQVELQVERTMRRFEWMAQNRRGRDRERPPPTEAELRDRYSRQYDNCRFTEQIFTPDLRKQLKDMADRGSVTGRYLYAMWPPDTFGKYDAFLVQQEWAEKALTYTLANLTEGETAGLLAFGQSYANNGMFTARDRNLGTAFIIAALDCGLELDYYATYVDRFLNSEQFMRDMEGDTRAQVLVMADGLKAFCR